MEEKFVVKSNPGYFKAVAPDMKFEQTIQRTQKSFGGIIGQTKQVAYVTEWELIYHEVLAISNCYEDLTQSSSSSSDAVILNRELRPGTIREYNESVESVIHTLHLPRQSYIILQLDNLYPPNVQNNGLVSSMMP